MATMEEALSSARQKGLYLNNLFELHKSSEDKTGNGQWQANFRHTTGWYDYGRGGSPILALEDALARCRGAKGPENRPIPKEPKPNEKPELDLDDLI